MENYSNVNVKCCFSVSFLTLFKLGNCWSLWLSDTTGYEYEEDIVTIVKFANLQIAGIKRNITLKRSSFKVVELALLILLESWRSGIPGGRVCNTFVQLGDAFFHWYHRLNFKRIARFHLEMLLIDINIYRNRMLS